MKTDTFENALVWVGPLVTVFVCIQAESKANEKRTKKITEKVQPASDQPIKPNIINDATLESGNVVHILQVFSFKSTKAVLIRKGVTFSFKMFFVKFNPRLALIFLRTTRPRSLLEIHNRYHEH